MNRIESLAENVLNAATGEYFSVDLLDMNGLGLAHFLLMEGGTLGDLYSLADYKYDSNGMIVVNEDGTIFVSAIDLDNAKRAITIIETIANDPEVGSIFRGVVTRLMSFGAFVEIAPGKEGLVHISKLDVKRTEKVEDCVTVGDEVIVKVLEIDDQGRINLSRRDALIEIEGLTPEDDGEEAPRRPRRDGDRRRDNRRRDR